MELFWTPMKSSRDDIMAQKSFRDENPYVNGLYHTVYNCRAEDILILLSREKLRAW